MVHSCCVIGCSNSWVKSSHAFYRFPKVNKRFNQEYQDLLSKRRETWMMRIKRANITENQLNSLRICGLHFVSGKPADFRSTNDPDWAPSIALGYTKHATSLSSKLKRHRRTLNRNMRKEDLAVPVEDSEQISLSDNDQNDVSTEETGTAVQTDITNSMLLMEENDARKLLKELNDLRSKVKELSWFDESCLKDDEKCRYFTGLPNVRVVTLLQSRIDEALSKIIVGDLNNFQKLLLTLMKLRLNTTFKGLSYRFNVRPNDISMCFKKVVVLLEYAYRFLIHWPEKDCLRAVMPECFLNAFGRSVAVIINCYEINTQRMSIVKAPSFPCYKRDTVKYLIGITPQGVVSYVSEGYWGLASDEFIREDCGIAKNLLPGDVVLADRGFKVLEVISKECAEQEEAQISLHQKQIHLKDPEMRKKMASVKVNVQRLIGNLRNKFRIMRGPVPIKFCSYRHNNRVLMEYIVRVCCILTNLCEPVIPLHESKEPIEIVESVLDETE